MIASYFFTDIKYIQENARFANEKNIRSLKILTGLFLEKITSPL
jgi:hypothetical protein